MKKTIVFLLVIIAVNAKAQQSILDKLQVKTSIKLGATTITSFSDDTTGTNQSSAKLLTERAAKLLIISRLNSFSQLPSQTGNSGKYLTTNGSTISWATVPTSAITSVFGRTGVVTAQSSDYSSYYANISHTHPYDQLTGVAPTVHTHAFSSLTSLPTTLAGYGITDNVTTQGNTFNAANKLLQLNSASAIPALDGGLITGINASNLSLGTIADGRLSTNVNLLDANQTVTGTKTNTNLFTVRGDNLATTQDYTKGIVLENTQAATLAIPSQYTPAMVFKSQIWGGDGTGGMNANATTTTQWKIEQRPVYNTGGSSSDNYLYFSVKNGNNSWADVMYLTKSGLTAPIASNTLTVGGYNSTNGTIQMRRWNGDVIFNLTAQAGYATLYSSLAFMSNMAFNTTTFTNGFTCNGNASFGTTSAAPSNGIVVAGESNLNGGILTPVSSKSANYTLTSTDECVKATTAGITFTLPTAVGRTGKQYTIVNATSGDITVTTTSSQNIGNYTTSTTLYPATNTSYILKSDGVGWLIIAKF